MRVLGLAVALVIASLVLLADDADAARKRILARKRAIDADQAEKRVALAEWCANQGLIKEAREEYDKAIALVGGNERWTRDRDNLQSRRPKKNRPGEAEDRAECEKSRQKLADAYGKLYGELAAQAREAGLDDLAGELQPQVAGPEDPRKEPPGNGKKEPPPACTPEQLAERINWFRKLAGLPPAAMDERLSWGAQNHAGYIHVNRIKHGVDLHLEIPGFRNYTDQGDAAARASAICWGSPADAVDGLMSEVFRRVPVLHPALERIGVGLMQRQVAVIDMQSGVTDPDVDRVVVFPVPDQTDVPTRFATETPDPLPPGSSGTAGYPVTLTQYDGERKITEATATLVDGKGKPVEAYLLTPETPSDPGRPLNTVALVPIRELAGATTYTATVKCKMQGVPFEQTWSFTTK